MYTYLPHTYIQLCIKTQTQAIDIGKKNTDLERSYKRGKERRKDNKKYVEKWQRTIEKMGREIPLFNN